MKKIYIELLGAKSILDVLGKILAVLSIVALARNVFQVGLAQTVMVLIEYYNKLVHALLGWTDPLIESLFRTIRQVIRIDLKIYPHWRHLFVLMSIYFLRVAIINYSYGYKRTGVFAGIWGILLAFSSSVLFGTVPISGLSVKEMMIASMIPIGGIFIFDLGRQLWITTFNRHRIAEYYKVPKYKWWVYFKPNLYICIGQALGSFLCVWLFLNISFVEDSRSPLLYAMGFLVLALALYRTILGIIEAPKLRVDNDGYMNAFLRTSSAGVALSMFSLFLWTFIFLVTSAGLEFFGL